jgi:hypothetical protein
MAKPATAAVTDADARDDVGWFDANAGRRYRIVADRHLVVRRYARGVFLRTIILPDHHHLDDGEGSAEAAWWASAYPHLSPEARAQMARESRQRVKAATHKSSNAKRRGGCPGALPSLTPQGSKS